MFVVQTVFKNFATGFSSFLCIFLPIKNVEKVFFIVLLQKVFTSKVRSSEQKVHLKKNYYITKYV